MIVCVGIPCVDGKPLAQTVDALLAEQFLCSREGVHLLVQWESGIPYVCIARNRLAKRFLDVKEADCMVFIDADMSWTPGTLLKLIRQPRDVIGGTYRTKTPTERFLVDAHEHKPEQVGDLWRVDGLPGGFLKVTRAAYEKINTRQYLDSNNEVYSDFFPTGWLGDRYYQEDYGFCWLWRMNGGEVWLDPSLHLRHHLGINQVFEGDAVEWMRTNHGARNL